jgi:tRNA threonylcarbamoyladenosine biosynthesis protein TsaE
MKELLSTKIRVKSMDETLKLGEIIGKLLKPGTIIALKGELGAGKTVLVKGIARGLGAEEEPNSPTFVIMNCYEGRLPLYHFDLYRVADEDELIAMGYEEFFFGGGVAAAEWADRVPEIFPEDAIEIAISIPEGPGGELENTREINIKGIKEWVLSFKNTAEQASLT